MTNEQRLVKALQELYRATRRVYTERIGDDATAIQKAKIRGQLTDATIRVARLAVTPALYPALDRAVTQADLDSLRQRYNAALSRSR